MTTLRRFPFALALLSFAAVAVAQSIGFNA